MKLNHKDLIFKLTDIQWELVKTFNGIITSDEEVEVPTKKNIAYKFLENIWIILGIGTALLYRFNVISLHFFNVIGWVLVGHALVAALIFSIAACIMTLMKNYVYEAMVKDFQEARENVTFKTLFNLRQPLYMTKEQFWTMIVRAFVDAAIIAGFGHFVYSGLYLFGYYNYLGLLQLKEKMRSKFFSELEIVVTKEQEKEAA